MIYGMNARTKKLLEEVLELPASERALLVAEVDASLDGEDTPEEVGKAWDAELERRIDDVVAGRVKTLDADEVLADLTAKYPSRR
jgi:putative addiction module component (TIGR02574 family)